MGRLLPWYVADLLSGFFPLASQRDPIGGVLHTSANVEVL